MDKQTEDYKVVLFLYCISLEAVKTYSNFDLAPKDKRNLTLIIEEFEKYAVSNVNKTYERFIFNSKKPTRWWKRGCTQHVCAIL